MSEERSDLDCWAPRPWSMLCRGWSDIPLDEVMDKVRIDRTVEVTEPRFEAVALEKETCSGSAGTARWGTVHTSSVPSAPWHSALPPGW